MKITPNIGILNALIRITFGLTIVAWSTSKMVKRPWRDSYLLAAFCGAMKVAEGIVRYCPVTDLCERWSDMVKEHQHATDSVDEMEELDGDADSMVPYNPT
ncbi:YgaP family membrane protein [Neobacillus vireti]|uniref:YgaP family membrane protein n=1 Tax=Neobacillus vireti TaxID=220686 RepID=UPI003000D4A0